MAVVYKEHIFEGNLDECFRGITGYLSYPEYIPGVIKVEVIKPRSPKAAIGLRYELNIVKTFFYELDMFHVENKEISWELVDSNLMKKNKGSWILEAQKKGSTLAKYQLDVDFKGLVPSPIIKKITESNLPAMFEGFQTLIKAMKQQK